MRTSGYPFGSKKASGIPQLGGTPGIRSERSEGGVGAAEYSVKAKPLILGVTGVVTLVRGSPDMLILSDLLHSLSERKSVKFFNRGRQEGGTVEEIELEDMMAPLTLFSCRGGTAIGACSLMSSTQRSGGEAPVQ